jgi:hypothetical protein
MPRNVSGTYSLPLPPVVANTVIQSAWANTTTDDIAQGITDSLDRNGRGGMIAPFRLVDGSVLQPAFAFASETGTGLYRVSAGIMGVSVMGVKVAQWSGASYDILNDLNLAGNLGVTGDILLAGDILGTITVTGGIAVAGGITSLDDIAIVQNFDGEAGFFTTNSSAGASASAVFNAVNNAGHRMLVASTGTAYTGLPAMSATGLLFSNTTQGIGLIASQATGFIRFAAGGIVEQMQLSAAGNLGIGLVPTIKLHVSDGVAGVARFNSTAATGTYIGIATSTSLRGRVGAGSAVVSGAALTDIGIRTENAGNILFSGSAGTEQMRLEGSSGNLGLGTNGPAASLHVQRTTSATIMAEAVSSGTAGLTLKANTAAANSAQVLFQSSAASLYALGAGNVGAIGATDFGLYSYLKARNIFNVTGADGFVGINENAPGTMLSVNSGTSGVAGLRVAVAGASNQGMIIIGNCTMQGGDDYVGFNWIRSVTTLMHLDANTGNLSVGMGATSGSVRVHAKAAGAGARLRAESSDASGVICEVTADSNRAGQVGTNTSHNMEVYANSTVRMVAQATLNTPLLHRQNSIDYVMSVDPGSVAAQIPIGAIVFGQAVISAGGAALSGLGTFVAGTAGQQISWGPFTGGATTTTITHGTWRNIGAQTVGGVGLFQRIA